MAGIMVVFDFDKTIIDCDSDNWVIDELGFTELFKQLVPIMPWNTLMDPIMREMHVRGVTIDRIVEVLKRVPIHPRVVPAIKAAHDAGCELRIVSDANQVFIETVLKHLGVRDCFTEINTNPSYVDDQGKLRILPYHDFNKSPHGCNRCPPNMCKGLVMERLLSSEGRKKLIYLGDGIGDYCPSLRLRECDDVILRKNYPLWELICSNPGAIKAKIHEWTDGAELENILLSLIFNNGDVNDDTTQFLNNAECKLQSIPTSSHQTLPHPLPVPL